MTRPVATIVSEATWDAFHARCPDATVFGSSRWLRCAARVFGGHPVYLLAPGDAAPHAKDRPGAADAHAHEAGIPLLVRHRGPFPIVTALPITLYQGMYASAGGFSDSAVEALFSHIERKTFFATLPLPVGSRAGAIAESRGWERIAQRTVRIPIDTIDPTWREFSQSLRRKIRRAEDAMLVCTTSDDLSIIAGMHEESYARHGMRPPVATTQLAAWLSMLQEERLITQYVARDGDGRARAARVVMCDGDTVYDWMAGMGAGSVHAAASHWLVWEIMRLHAERGMRIFDFMGANTVGVSDFKFLFGGSVVHYDVVRFRRSRAVRWLEQVKDRVTTRRRLR